MQRGRNACDFWPPALIAVPPLSVPRHPICPDSVFGSSGPRAGIVNAADGAIKAAAGLIPLLALTFSRGGGLAPSFRDGALAPDPESPDPGFALRRAPE